MFAENIYVEFLRNSKWKLPEVLDCDEIFNYVSQQTGVSVEVVKKIINYYFLEIKINLLYGKLVYLTKIGKFFISSPTVIGTKKKIYPNFMLHETFRQTLNGVPTRWDRKKKEKK